MLRSVVVLCLVSVTFAGPPVTRTRSEIENFKNFLEETRTEHGVLLGRQNPNASAWENSGKYQGDILLYDEEVESMVEQFAEGRVAYVRPRTTQLWPGRTVVYELAPHFTQAQINQIYYSMSIISDRTCIRFRRRNPGEFSYTRVTGYNTGCWAGVGFWPSRSIHGMNLTPNTPGRGCFNTIVIIHEWLHVIGFFHMQSAYNRYNHVRINWHNMVRGMEYNFDRWDSRYTSMLGLPYELDSCMHYGPYSFSANGRTTMDALWAPNSQMGTMRYVTSLDFQRVNRLYGCTPWRKLEDIEPYYDDFGVIPELNEETQEDPFKETKEQPEETKTEYLKDKDVLV